MWRLLLGSCLLLGALPIPTEAQQWTGTAALSAAAGHQSNAYLDPVLRSWDLLPDPAFAAVTPRVGLVRKGRRSRLHVAARTRLYPRRPNAPQFAQGYAHYRYQLASAWAVGALGGGTRYRFTSSRNSAWMLPTVEWTPTSSSTLTLRGGVSRRYAAPTQTVTDRRTSAVLTLQGRTWLSERLHLTGRLYWSNGATRASDVQFGGTGASVRSTYWLTNEWSVETEAAVEQVRYGTDGSSTTRDHIGRVGLKAQWNVRPAVTLFARAQTSAARLARTDEVDTDAHVSVGLRLQASRVLGGSVPTSPPRRVCTPVDNGFRLRIPYDGSGTLHVTGDFNGWSLPGVPLIRNDDTWTTTVPVPPGEFAYRIRVVDGDNPRWLDLPPNAQTAEDAFGGTNGVCTVP